jgi:hypothetical protein
MLPALSTRRPPITVIPALLLVGVALWEVCAACCDARSVPDDDAWERAASVVRTDLQSGDLIVFAPDWVDPVGRLHLGDRISLDMAGRMDAAKYARIWELSIRGARAPEVEGLSPAFEQEQAGVTVRRYERVPVQVIADVRERLAEAQLRGGRASLELAEVGFAPHRCVQVVPAPGQPVRVTFPQLALGTTLVGYVGLADVFTRRDIRAPGTLEVELGGRVIASTTVGVDDGWVRFEAPTQPGVADLTFIASASAPQRQICFAAETRR